MKKRQQKHLSPSKIPTTLIKMTSTVCDTIMYLTFINKHHTSRLVCQIFKKNQCIFDNEKDAIHIFGIVFRFFYNSSDADTERMICSNPVICEWSRNQQES